MEQIIFHIDVNSAYLSWTAVEQLKNGAEVLNDYQKYNQINDEISELENQLNTLMEEWEALQ